MQKGLFFLFLILISLSNDSCTTCSCQKLTCPPYQDSALDAWMKTFTNKTILFKNQNGQTDTFTISTPNQSSAYEASKGCMGAQNGCTASLNIYSTELVGLKDLKFFLEYNSFTGWDNITSKQIRIGLKGVVLLAD